MTEEPHSEEELILVAEDCPCTRGTEPPNNAGRQTVARIGYEILMCNPYTLTEREFQREVHIVRRQRPELRIEHYTIRRSPLVKKYGWGIHRNREGKLALVGCESEWHAPRNEEHVIG